MTHKLDSDDLFIHSIQRLCAESRLNFFLVEPLWVERFHKCLQEGSVWTRVLLNMHSEHHQPEDIFHQLVNLAAEKGCQVIDPPERARAAFDKSRLHPRLVEAGIPVPPTVVVPRDRPPGWTLTKDEEELLGSPFVIKPAMGYGRQGLVLDATSGGDIERSIEAWKDENYLFQRRILPAEMDGTLFYFRIFHVFGEIWITWWNCFTDHYRLVTDEERARFGLEPLAALVRQIAELTGMTFFSSEIARMDSGEHVVIDYVNDQCHMLSQSAHPQMGVPDELVQAIARRLVASVAGMVH